MADLTTIVRRTLEAEGLDVQPEVMLGLITYLELLSKWNRKINLTAFDLDSPTDAAITRLIAEPVRAARAVQPSDRVAVDVGSGGGSPGLPLLLMCPWMRMTLVEARQRKAAFLREAVRVLGLDAEVAAVRFEDRAIGERSVDVLSMRAVRPDRELVARIERVLAAGGKFIWFGDIGDITKYTDSIRCSGLSETVHVVSF